MSFACSSGQNLRLPLWHARRDETLHKGVGIEGNGAHESSLGRYPFAASHFRKNSADQVRARGLLFEQVLGGGERGGLGGPRLLQPLDLGAQQSDALVELRHGEGVERLAQPM